MQHPAQMQKAPTDINGSKYFPESCSTWATLQKYQLFAGLYNNNNNKYFIDRLIIRSRYNRELINSNPKILKYKRNP